uniref:Uncharacterized protein n=1 Tax=Anguilla anguilla TaxID=7936 RepID=A0A0E9RYA4_ANGAN
MLISSDDPDSCLGRGGGESRFFSLSSPLGDEISMVYFFRL